MRSTSKICAVAALMFLTSCSHYGSDGYRGMKGDRGKEAAAMMTVESQEKMAKMHTEAAQCIRRGNTPESCRNTLMNDQRKMCKDMGMEHCREMNSMMGGR